MLTQVYVVQPSNTLLTSGSSTTNDLAADQFSIFKPDYTPATAANVGGSKYIFLGQGRAVAEPGLGTKLSPEIPAAKIKEWYKITGSATANVQIATFTGFDVGCEETITVRLHLRSKYINAEWKNGLIRSVVIKTDCCNCGDNPCTEVDKEDLVDAIKDAINADAFLATYVVATRAGSGDSSVLTITGNAITPDAAIDNPHANIQWFDRIYFNGWAFKGDVSSQEQIIPGSCDEVAAFAVTQKATYAIGTDEEVIKVATQNHYANTGFPQLFEQGGYNPTYHTGVVAGTTYTQYYLETEPSNSMNPESKKSYIIFVPNGETTTIEAILTAFVGNSPEDKTP